MEVHHGGSNVGEPRSLDVGAESHSWVETRASDSNRDLQSLQAGQNQVINIVT